jgi:hypothetical protein
VPAATIDGTAEIAEMAFDTTGETLEIVSFQSSVSLRKLRGKYIEEGIAEVKWANVARQVTRVALIMAASIQRNNERVAARGNGRWAMGGGRWAMGDGRWAKGDYWTGAIGTRMSGMPSYKSLRGTL